MGKVIDLKNDARRDDLIIDLAVINPSVSINSIPTIQMAVTSDRIKEVVNLIPGSEAQLDYIAVSVAELSVPFIKSLLLLMQQARPDIMEATLGMTPPNNSTEDE